MQKVSVGVIAYNEEAAIGGMLDSVLSQEGPAFSILEVICVSSACSDGTDGIILAASKKDKRVRLVSQKEREGKASAVDLFLKEAKGDVCVLSGADTKLAPGTLQALLSPFEDPKTGMTGGRPVPVNDASTFIGFADHLLWELHHELALLHPKLGELTAFRNVVKEIPKDSAVDEASIEAKITKLGLALKYCPDAVVYNRGPGTVSDFLKQRRRIYAGHLWLKKSAGYSTSTMKAGNILRALSKRLSVSPKWLFFSAGTIFLEILGRLQGSWDFYISKKSYKVWDRIESTKKL